MPRRLVLTDFVLIDGAGGPPRPHADVVVEDGVIAAVDFETGRPGGAHVMEGNGRWLLPGLWDTHIHHGFSAGGFVGPEEFSEQQRLNNWRAYLRSGVTSVMSVGDDSSVLAARATERNGTLAAPRIVASGGVFTAPGGHPAATILHGEASRFAEMAVEVDDPADARARLRRFVEDDGRDVVKLVYSHIPGNVPRLARPVMEALVDEAHDCARPVFAHVATPEDAAHCIAAGVDGLEHMALGDDEALAPVFASAAETGVFWTPTLSLFDKMAHDGDEAYVEGHRPAGYVSTTVLRSLRDPAAWWRRPDPNAVRPPWARTIDLTGQAHAAAVRLALGTDSGNPAVFHGLAVHRELQLLVRAGLTPLEAIVSATAVAAPKPGWTAPSAPSSPARRPTWSCCGRTRSTTSRTPARSTW